MKSNYIIYISFFFLLLNANSCNLSKTDHSHKLTIDLDNTNDTILYSQFTKSIDYIELNTNDSCIVSHIDNIFLDDDTIFILDKKNAGILIFTSNGELVNQINNYGNSAEEFINIRAFTIDPILNHIYILDCNSQKINKYNYNGDYLESHKSTLYVRDFAVLENGSYLCILPYYSKYTPYGIWTTDNNNNIIKKIQFEIPQDDQFEFVGYYTNLSNQCIYYYDRNWDNFSCITKDTAIVQYQFDLKQRLKEDIRKKDPRLIKLKDFAMMSSFSYSDNFLLLTYYYYVDNNPYRWALYNKHTQKITVSNVVTNDIDYVQSSSEQIFYLNNKTWCRVLDEEVNNCNIQLQILNLK